MEANKSSRLIDVQAFIPHIQIDLRYATLNNFTNQIVYDFDKALLHPEAALQLKKVQVELLAQSLSLKIWDAYRPLSAQWKFWSIMPDERYVSHPAKGGRHTKGTSVDVTLVDLNGEELEMPTGFDDFSSKAHFNDMTASQKAIDNRNFLQAIMTRHGFIGYEAEWWHFDLLGWENYPVIENYQIKSL